MSGPRPRLTCRRCAKDVSQRAARFAVAGETVAHKCPHGRTCVAPAWARIKPSCGACEAARIREGAPLPPNPTIDELVAAGLVKRGLS